MIKRVLRRLLGYKHRFTSHCYAQKCRFDTYLSGGIIEIGDKVHFDVPASVDGRGRVILDAASSFGFHGAMRQGSGEILLQARTSEALLSIGSNCHFSNNVSIIACHRITLGSDCLLGDGVTIIDSDFHGISPDKRFTSSGECQPVIIGNNVWLGSRVMVLKGVSIGDNSIVGPMSVVTRDVPANVIVAGIPARKVRDIG